MISTFINYSQDSSSMVVTLLVEEVKSRSVCEVFQERGKAERWIARQHRDAFASCVLRFLHQRKQAYQHSSWPREAAICVTRLEANFDGLAESPLVTVVQKIHRNRESLLALLPHDASIQRAWIRVINDLLNQVAGHYSAMATQGGNQHSNNLKFIR